MLVFFASVAVAILLVTHYSAFAYGVRRTKREIWYSSMGPLVKRVRALYGETLKVSLEPNAAAQQRNVKLEVLNYRLRRKAIIYATKYRVAARRLRGPSSKLEVMVRLMSVIAETQDRLHPK